LELPNINGCLELAPALAAGNTVVLKPAESTPISILVLMELMETSCLQELLIL
jgi:aldehyde dehydrogenase